MAEQVEVRLRPVDPDDEVDGYAAFATGLRRQVGEVASHHRPPRLAKAIPSRSFWSWGRPAS